MHKCNNQCKTKWTKQQRWANTTAAKHTENEEKNGNDDDDEINGRVILKHLLLETARFVWIWVCLSFPLSMRLFFLLVFVIWQRIRGKRLLRIEKKTDGRTRKKTIPEIAGKTNLQMVNSHE